MPSIPLDTKHWTRVAPGPEDESITVTPRGFACYYSNNSAPPELASEGTEAGTGTGVTFETTRWFRAKEPGSTEAPVQPSILEVSQATAGEGVIDTAEIANEAVTTAKIKLLNVTTGTLAANAVTEAKLATAVDRLLLGTTAPEAVKTVTEAEGVTGIEPSATKAALVTVSILGKAEATNFKVEVGAVNVGEQKSTPAAGDILTIGTYLVQKATKIKVTKTAGAVTSVLFGVQLMN